MHNKTCLQQASQSLMLLSVRIVSHSYRHKTYQLSGQCAKFTWHNGQYARAQMDRGGADSCAFGRGGAESTTFDLKN